MLELTLLTFLVWLGHKEELPSSCVHEEGEGTPKAS